jgi:succinate dehydrogenase hydrophobic membrane anchor protein
LPWAALAPTLARMAHTAKKKGGLEAWIALRALALALIPLTAWLAWFIWSATGLDHAGFVALLAKPWHAAAAAFLVVTATAHATLGAHEIMEDYIACVTARRWAIIATDMAAAAFALACLVAIGAVVFGLGGV